MSNFNKKTPPLRYWLASVVGLLASAIVVLFFIEQLKTQELTNVLNEIHFYNTTLDSHISEFKKQEDDFISMISESKELHSFLINNHDPSSTQQLFYNLAKSKHDIMQIRFIDLKGMEKIRVDQNTQHKIQVIQTQVLQDKSDRYYVQQFLKLPKNQIGYSDFDLNVEHGVVEKPFNPTLRIGKGVYVDNELQGIIVINYFMGEWLEQLSSIFPYKIFLINKENYFMYHFDKKWEWSKYQNLPTTALAYPTIAELPNWQAEDKPYFILSDTLIGEKTHFFKDDVLIVYNIGSSLSAQITSKTLKYVVILILSFLVGFFPFIFLVYSYMKITKQNADIQSTLLNNLFDALIVINQKAIIKHVNKNTLELFGYSYKELIGHNVNMLVPEPHHSEHDQYVASYNKEDRTIIGKNREVEAVTKDGTKIPISLAVTKTIINNEVFFIGVLRDLRDIKELEDINKKQNVLIQQQSKLAAMGEMIGAIAHQWRQPLNELSIRIQKLKYSYAEDKVDEEFIKQFIEKNRDTINFMSQTIDDFRNFFRIDKNKVVFDVKSTIEETINLQNAQLYHRNIHVNLSGDTFKFEGYKSEFQQVLLNIFSNAKDIFKTNETEEPTIDVTIQDNIIYIQDNGGGIPEDILTRAFEPYFTTKAQGEGTGMGLYLSKMIIEENMQGKITLENKGDGVLVTIVLKYNPEG